MYEISFRNIKEVCKNTNGEETIFWGLEKVEKRWYLQMLQNVKILTGKSGKF